MANTLTLLRKKRSIGNFITFVFSAVLSGSYTSSGGVIGTPGETLNFQAASSAAKIARAQLPNAPAGALPPNSTIRVTRCPDGYDAMVEQNATSPTTKNYAMRMFTSGNTELGSGAYAAGVTADTTGVIIEIDVPMKYN